MVLLIAIVLGALVGAAVGEGAGALFGALFGWLVVRSLRQQREIEALRQGVGARPTRAARSRRCRKANPCGTSRGRRTLDPRHVDRGRPRAVPTTATTLRGNPRQRQRARRRPPLSGASDRAALVAAKRPSSPRFPPRFRSSSPWHRPRFVMPRRAQPNAATARAAAPPLDVLAPIKRWLFGGNTIVKAGIGILFVGLAFLAKYASEHAHVPVEVRLAAIGMAAVVLLGFGWRLRLVAPRLRPGAARRRRRRPLPDALRRVPLLRRPRADAGVRADGRGRRARRRPGGAPGRALARRHRRARRLRDAADRLDRLQQLRRPVRLLLRARPRHRRGRVVEDVARAQPDRLHRDLRRRRRLGRAQVPARRLRHRPGVPDRVLPPLRRHPGPAGATPRGRRIEPGRRRGARAHAWVNSSLLFGLPTIVFALEYGLVRGTPYGAALAALVLAALLRDARDVDAAPARARHHLRGDARDRDRLPHPRHSVRARRAQHRRRVDARRRGADLDRLSPAARRAAGLRLRPPRHRGAGDAARPRAPRRPDGASERVSLQRADGGGGVARRRLLRPSRRPRRRVAARRRGVRDAADRRRDRLAPGDGDDRDGRLRSVPPRPRRRAGRGERDGGALRVAGASARLARARLDVDRARADPPDRRSSRCRRARQSVRGRRLVGLADRLGGARARPASRRLVLAGHRGARRPRRRRGHARAGRRPGRPGLHGVVGRLRERLAVARLARRAGDDAAAPAASGHRPALAGARAACRVPAQRGRRPRRRPVALDARRQRRFRRLGGAAALPAVPQPARHRHRHRPRRALCSG